MKRYINIAILLLVGWIAQAQNNPYIDERTVHFGFYLGVNLSAFGVTDSQDTINGDVYHARVSSLMPGFDVGFVTDVRLARHLSLRFTPGLQFTSRTLKYISESGTPVSGTGSNGSTVDILSIPVYLPLYLKWAAEREQNYRPYVIGGGGVAFNVSRDREKPVLLEPMDYFAEVGFGCDFYFSWFKFCPQLTYRIGFANQLSTLEGRSEVAEPDHFYTQALRKLTNHAVVLTFNFE